MTPITLTVPLAFAAGQDAGNAQMRKAGRTRWTAEDFNTASAVTAKLLRMLLTPAELADIGMETK